MSSCSSNASMDVCATYWSMRSSTTLYSTPVHTSIRLGHNVLWLFSCTISVYFLLVSSNHFPIFTKLSVDSIPLPPPTYHSFRRFHSIDIDSFLRDLQSSRLITSPPTSLGSLLIAYNTTLSSLLDKHVPVVTKLTTRRSSPWFSPTLRAFRATVRHTENLYKHIRSAVDWSSFKSLRNQITNWFFKLKSNTTHT